MSAKRLKWHWLLSLSLVYSCAPAMTVDRGNPMVGGVAPEASPRSAPSQAEASALPDFTPLSADVIEELKASGLIAAQNKFSWKFMANMYKQTPEKNMFFSPLSASLALQMILKGARGETREELLQGLFLKDLSTEQLQNSRYLLQKLQRPAEDIQLTVANSIWSSPSAPFLESYVKQVQQDYDAEALTVNFRSPQAANQLNAWVSQKTQGAISQLYPPDQAMVDEDTELLLNINALYFHADWSQAFDQEETTPKPFYKADGTTVTVPMMRQFGRFAYRTPDDHFPHQSIVLPYGDTYNVAMYVFLPTTGQTLSDLQRDLQSVDFETLLSEFYGESGSFELPRFELRQEFNLNNVSEAMGMTQLLGNPDLTGMTNVDSLSCNVRQLTYLKVNEEGTEAAAVTVVEASSEASSEPLTTLSMRVDHPFVFLIRDQDTGQILFMGSITEPQAS